MSSPINPPPNLPSVSSSRCKGGRPHTQAGALPQKCKADEEYSTNEASVKRRRRLEGLSAMEHEIEKAVTHNRINKKNATDRYLKTPEYLGLQEDEKEGAKAAFVAHWVEVK